MAIYTIKTGCLAGSLDTGGRKIVRGSNGVLHVVYHRLETVNNIFHSYSSDGGVTWTEEAITTDVVHNQQKASVAIDSNDVLHVVWECETDGYTKICYSKRNLSWSSPLDLSNDASYDQATASIAIDSSNRIFVVWAGNGANGWKIKYSIFSVSWTSPADIPGQQIGAWYNYYNACPSLAIDDSSNRVCVVWNGFWTGGADNQIQYSIYTSAWSNAAVITSENYDQMYAHIAFASNGDALVVWHGKSSRNTTANQIQFSRYTSSWSTPIDLSSSAYDQACATIAVDSLDNIYVVWFQYGNQIKYTKYTVSTGSWSAAVSKTTGTSYKWHPYIMWQNQIYSIPTTGYCFVYMDDTTLKFYVEATLYVKPFIRSFPWVGKFSLSHVTA